MREESGLAMSSRNELLSAEERKNAAVISESLFKAKELRSQKSVQELVEWIKQNINKNRFLTVEYVEIVDDEKLQPIKSWNEKKLVQIVPKKFLSVIFPSERMFFLTQQYHMLLKLMM